MSEQPASIAHACLQFTGLFEAELLTRLMLWKWGHPQADDPAFANDLLEGAAEVLRKCETGERLIAEIAPSDMSFVAAAWYAEWAAVTSTPGGDPHGRRQAWLDAVRRGLPSCFCDPADLV
jgi:hypothetical protein